MPLCRHAAPADNSDVATPAGHPHTSSLHKPPSPEELQEPSQAQRGERGNGRSHAHGAPQQPFQPSAYIPMERALPSNVPSRATLLDSVSDRDYLEEQHQILDSLMDEGLPKLQEADDVLSGASHSATGRGPEVQDADSSDREGVPQLPCRRWCHGGS